MNTVVRIGIIFSAVIALAVSSSLYGQSYNRAVILRNLSADTIALYPPGDHLTSHSLTLPRNPPGLGGIFYAIDALGSTEWLSAGLNNDILQVVSGVPSWQNPNTALDDNFVRYNIGTTQSLATTTGGNFLFNVEYGTTNAAAAAGARINSLTTLANSNATGLTLNATATGVGTSRGLVVTTSGGTSNYAATFNGGDVGVGTTTPGARLDVEQTATNRSGTVEALTTDQNFTIPNTGNTFDNIAIHGTLNGVVSAISSGGTLTGIRGNSYLNGVVTGNVTQMRGVLGTAAIGTAATVSSIAVGVEGSVAYSSSVNVPSLTCLLATSGPGTPLTGTGTIASWNGLYITNPTGTSTITTLTGIRIDALTYAAATTTNALFYNHPTVPFVIKGSGNVAIGTSDPGTSRLRVTETYSPSTVSGHLMNLNTLIFSPTVAQTNTTIIAERSELLLSPSVAVTGEHYAIDGGISLLSSATIDVGARTTGVRGFVSSLNSTQTVSSANGVQGHIQTFGPMTVANALSTSYISLAATGVTQTYRGLYVETPSVGSGSINNVYGIDISELNSGVSNTAFRYNHSTSPVIVSGNGRIGIGASSTTPATQLDVDGGVVVRPPSTIAVAAAANITVGNESYIRLNPTGGAGVNVGLAGGNTAGHILIVEVLDNAANTLTFVDAAAQNLSLEGGNFTPANTATLMFVWNGTIWMELSRRTNN